MQGEGGRNGATADLLHQLIRFGFQGDGAAIGAAIEPALAKAGF